MATVTSSKRHLLVTSDTYTSNGDVTVGGDLFVNGSQTIINTTTLNVEDKNITLNYGGTEASSQGAGITIVGSNATFVWDEANTRWSLSNGLVVSGNISASNLSGTNTGDQDLSGYLTTTQAADDFVDVTGDTMTGTLTVPNLIIGSGNKIQFANNDYIRYDDANGNGRFHFDADGGTNNASVQAATFVGALSTTGISGSNYNITGVNQLEINDPGEGIIWKAGSSGDITLAVVDDASDNILRLSGTGATLQVGTNRVLTTADEGSGNGLDADLLDGQHGSYYAVASSLGNYLPLAGGTMTGDLLMDGKAGVGNVIGLATGINSNAMSLKLYTYNNIDPGGGLGTSTGNMIQADLGSNLVLRQTASDGDITFQSDDGSGGIATYFQLDGSHTQSIAWKDIHFADGIKAKFGDYASPDLQIYHDGSNSYINDSGIGDLYIQGSDDIYITAANGEKFITCNTDGSVEIRYDNVKKFETTSTGVSVTGQTVSSAAFISNAVDTGNPQATTDQLRVSGYGVMGNRGALYFTNASGGGNLQFGIGGSHASNTQLTITNAASTFAGTIAVQGTGDSYFTGNVGIGATSPSEKLEVVGNAIITGDVTLSNGNALRWTSDDVRIEGTTAGDNIKFYVANTEILKLAQSGTLATVTGNLRVTGAYYDSNNLPGTSGQVLSSTATGTDWVSLSEISGVDGTGTANYVAKWSDTDTITDSVIYDDGTNVGIGTTSPAQKLHVIGNSEITGDIFLGRYIFHNDDTNTWLGFPLADTISFRTNGSDRMYINSSGNVGIGTTSPSEKLHVAGSSVISYSGTNANYFGQVNSGFGHGYIRPFNSSGLFGFDTNYTFGGGYDFAYNGASVVRINSGGNVGIGTTGPSAKLDVASGDIRLATNATYFRVRDTASAQPRVLGINAANTFYIGPIDSYAGGAMAYGVSGNLTYHGFYGGGSEKVRITSAGNVGIGTTSPTYKLDVNGDGRFGGTTTSANTALTVRARSGDLGDLRFRFDAAGTLQRSYISDYYTGEASNIGFERNNSTGVGIITFDTSNGSFSPSERMRINSDGNVGIGTTSPGAKLDIFNTGGSAGSLADCQTYSALTIKPYSSVDSKLTFSANGVSTQLIQATNNAGTTGRQISLQPFSGNVGIGVTLPSEKLDVNGSIKASATTDAYKGYIKQNVISYGAEKLESSNYYFFAYNTTSTVTTAQAYNRIVAAYDGRVKKVYIRHSGGSTPTATAVNFKKHTNGTTSSTVYAATVTNTASANMTAYYEFAQTDFSFNAGDLIGLLYQTTDAFGTASKTMGGVAVTITLEYNIT